MFSKDKKINWKKVAAVLFSTALLVTVLAGCVAPSGETPEGEASTGGFGGWTLILYLVIIVLVFYFFMIRPEKKRKKKAEDMRNNIAIGDNVTTIGGMVGKVVNVSGDFITFETGEDRVRIKIAKWGISSIGKAADEPVEKADGQQS